MWNKIQAGKMQLINTGFLHIFGASTLNQVLSFLSGIVLVRVLSKVEYGYFSIALSIYQFFLIISGLGLASGILQMCSEYLDNPETRNKIYAYGSSLGLRVNILLAFSIFLVSILVPFPMGKTNELLIWFSGLPILTVAYEIGIAKLRADLRAKAYSYVNTINMVLYSAFSILGAIFFKIKGLIIGRYIAYFLSIIILGLVFDIKPYLNTLILDKEYKIPLIKISLLSVVNNGLSTLFNILEIFVLGLVVLDSTVTASYKVAITIPAALNFVPSAFAIYIYPYFAKHRNDKNWVKKKYLLSILGLGLMNLIITIIFLIFAELLVVKIFGSQYLDSVPAFRLLMIGYFIGGTFRVLAGNLLVSQRKLIFNTVVATFGFLLSLIFNILLIPKHGIIGAAWAHVIVLSATGLLNTVKMVSVTFK